MTTTEKNKKFVITVTMSERAPLNLDPELWSLIARADNHDGMVACQANQEWSIRVREHTDGRRVVYGWSQAGYGGMPIGYRGASGGYIVSAGPNAGEETIRAIRRVAGIICDDQLGDECIADLPTEELV